MPATGPDSGVVLAVTRRAVLAALIPVAMSAAETVDRTAITEMFGAVAASLSEENPNAALKWFDPAMPHLAKLRSALVALVDKFEVSSAISILSIENDAVMLDWFLELKNRGSSEPVARRRANLKCTVGRRGKVWQIRSLEPVEFFD